MTDIDWLLAFLALIGAIIPLCALLTGAFITRRGYIRHSEQPQMYWFLIILVGGLALIFAGVLLSRQWTE